MKVETPQLRWHQEMNPSCKQDESANGPIRSCSLLTLNNNVGILATAGNAEVNLWRVGFTADETRLSSNTNTTSKKQQGAQDGASTKNDGACEPTSHILVQPVKNKDEEPANKAEHTQIKHIVTLSRGTSERAINAVKFSPPSIDTFSACVNIFCISSGLRSASIKLLYCSTNGQTFFSHEPT